LRASGSDRFVPDHDKPPDNTEHILGQALPTMAGALLVCDQQHQHIDDCVAQWIDAADALRKQRDEHALFGARCERLLERDFAFDEVLTAMRSTAEPLALHAIGASKCSAWLVSGAVLAWSQQDRVRAVALMAQADRLNRALLDGSHSLIGQMIAVRVTRNTLAAAAALVVRDPSLAAAIKPLLAPLPDPVPGIKRWMAVEAAFLHGAITDIERGEGHDQASGDLRAWLFRQHIGWHPQRTMQLSDAHWLRAITQLDGGLEAAIRVHASDAADHAGDARPGLTWVNPVGSALVEINRPTYASYLARHADLALHHEVTVLAVDAAAAGVPAAERREWTARQPLSPSARARVTWSDDGLMLGAHTWQETSTPDRQVPPRDAIRTTWPASR
jgi:hypothetical protein